MARPLKYKTIADLQAAIDQYFEDCEGKPIIDEEGNAVTDKYGNVVIVGMKHRTVTGLALALGFSSRQGLLNYQGKKEFMDAITRAKSRCEEYAEGMLYDKNGSRGAQFSLRCNFRWDDTPELEKQRQQAEIEKMRRESEQSKEGSKITVELGVPDEWMK